MGMSDLTEAAMLCDATRYLSRNAFTDAHKILSINSQFETIY